MSYTPPPVYTNPAPPNNSMALVSLIAGILGLTLLPFFGSIVAVVTGNMAKREILESRGTQGGEGLATAGTILGWIGIVLGVLTLCGVGLAFVVPLCLVSLGLMAEGQTLLLPALLALAL